MSEPSVCCICLTADRQRLTDRAVECFLRQTYGNRMLLIYDTGREPYEAKHYPGSVTTVHNPASRGKAIGALRNEAIDMVKADIIAHWDSDDWSARYRLPVQAMALQSRRGVRSEACTLQNMLFLDTRPWPVSGKHIELSAAYEYDCAKVGAQKVIGTSLVYWRDVWKAQPFREFDMTGEDNNFARNLALARLQGIVPEPLMIAEVHGGNTSEVYKLAFDDYRPAFRPEWRRAPEWDTYAKERLHP